MKERIIAAGKCGVSDPSGPVPTFLHHGKKEGVEAVQESFLQCTRLVQYKMSTHEFPRKKPQGCLSFFASNLHVENTFV